MMENALVEK